MALQTSGAISFANLQSEFGGSHPITMGEYASFRVSGSGNTISMNQFYGASASLDTQTVTVGVLPAGAYNPAIYGFYDIGSSIGSVSDGTCNFKSGATYRRLQWTNATGQNLLFALNGTHANSGWTTMNIAGTNFTRSSSTYSQLSGEARWSWSTSTNPFGTTSGATKTVTFT